MKHDQLPQKGTSVRGEGIMLQKVRGNPVNYSTFRKERGESDTHLYQSRPLSKFLSKKCTSGPGALISGFNLRNSRSALQIILYLNENIKIPCSCFLCSNNNSRRESPLWNLYRIRRNRGEYSDDAEPSEQHLSERQHLKTNVELIREEAI